MAATRTERAYRFFSPFFRLYLRRKCGYRYDSFAEVKGPYLLLCNHTMDMDPIMLGCAAGRDLRFVASEHIMRKGFGTWFLQRYFNPIVHVKGKLGLKSSMEILRAVRRGECVALFPEGNRSFNGSTGDIPAVTAKLAKSTGVPLITYRMEGGYLTQPRWSVSLRKGRVTGHLVRVYSAEELKAAGEEELLASIRADLFENAYASNKSAQIPYCGKALARGIEAAVFSCPVCGGIGTLRSEGNFVRCTCGFSAEYQETGWLKAADGTLHTVTAWDEAQRERLKAMVEDAGEDDILFSNPLTAERIGDDHKVEARIRGELRVSKRGAFFGERFVPLGDIRGLAVHSRNTITAHIGSDETQYELRGEEAFSALKYRYLYQLLQGKK